LVTLSITFRLPYFELLLKLLFYTNIILIPPLKDLLLIKKPFSKDSITTIIRLINTNKTIINLIISKT